MKTVTAGVAGVCAFSSDALYAARSKYDFGRFDFSYAFHARGLIVTDVTPGGPAWDVLFDDPQRGGPDIILSVEGKPVHTEAELRKTLQGEKAGSIVTLRVYNPRAQARRVERIRLGDAKK